MKIAILSTFDSTLSADFQLGLKNLIGCDAPRVAYIASGDAYPIRQFNTASASYSQLGATSVEYFDPSELADAAVWARAASCDVIHLPGGNPLCFASALRRYGVMSRLRQYAESGRPLVGVSAGAIVMSTTVETGLLTGDLPLDNESDCAGMGLLNFHVFPHSNVFQTFIGAQKRLIDRLESIYACPDGGGITVDNGRITFFGDVRLMEKHAKRAIGSATRRIEEIA